MFILFTYICLREALEQSHFSTTIKPKPHRSTAKSILDCICNCYMALAASMFLTALVGVAVPYPGPSFLTVCDYLCNTSDHTQFITTTSCEEWSSLFDATYPSTDAAALSFLLVFLAVYRSTETLQKPVMLVLSVGWLSVCTASVAWLTHIYHKNHPSGLLIGAIVGGISALYVHSNWKLTSKLKRNTALRTRQNSLNSLLPRKSISLGRNKTNASVAQGDTTNSPNLDFLGLILDSDDMIRQTAKKRHLFGSPSNDERKRSAITERNINKQNSRAESSGEEKNDDGLKRTKVKRKVKPKSVDVKTSDEGVIDKPPANRKPRKPNPVATQNKATSEPQRKRAKKVGANAAESESS